MSRPPGAYSDPVPWTEEEVENLKRYYPHHGLSGTTKRMRTRTRKAIMSKAVRLGLKAGDIDGYVRVGAIDRLVGLAPGTARNAAVHRNVGKVTTNREAHVVPAAWADKYIREAEERLRNDELADKWYDVKKVARLFGVSIQTVHSWARGERGKWAAAFDEIDTRKTSKRKGNKIVFNPWQIEDLITKIRRGEMVLSVAQAMVLIRLLEPGCRLVLAEETPGAVPSIKRWYLMDEKNERVAVVRRGTITNFRTYKLITTLDAQNQTEFGLTDAGREEAERRRDEIDSVL